MRINFDRVASNPGFYPDPFTETKLAPSERPKRVYEYVVTGMGAGKLMAMIDAARKELAKDQPRQKSQPVRQRGNLCL